MSIIGYKGLSPGKCLTFWLCHRVSRVFLPIALRKMMFSGDRGLGRRSKGILESFNEVSAFKSAGFSDSTLQVMTILQIVLHVSDFQCV